MKSNDIVQHLALKLPELTDKFTTNLSVISITRSGTTVTAQTSAAHNLAVGAQVNIQGAKTPLTVASLTRAGTVGTLVTDNNHDLTEGYSTRVELTGAAEAEFVGTFTILTVSNRKTVTFTMVDAGPTVATGSPLLLNGSSAYQSYNGLYAVTTTPASDTFTYEIANSTIYTPAAGTITARMKPRISAAVDPRRLVEAYTKQNDAADLWAFVVIGDVSASKSREIQSDATANIQRSNTFRQQCVFPFSVFVFFPTSHQIHARQARDDAEDLFPLLCQSLLFKKFDSYLYRGAQNPVVFVDHGFFAYNKAHYVHVFNFETVADLTFNDTIGYDVDVAFRDIDTNINLGHGTGVEVLTANINLDDVPL